MFDKQYLIGNELKDIEIFDNNLIVWTSNTTYEQFYDYLCMNAERYCIYINKLMIDSNKKFQEVVVLLLRNYNA